MKIIKKKSTLKPDIKAFVDKLGIQDKSANFSDGHDQKNKRKRVKKPKFKSKNEANAATDMPEKHIKIQNKPLLIKPGTIWYEKTTDLDCPLNERVTPQELSKWRNEAQQIFNNEIANYKQFLRFRKEKSDFTWAQMVLKSGTLTDKMAAHLMMVQDSPVHTLDSIDILNTMVNTKGKRECILAIENLKELFLSCLLSKERKLKAFETRPLSKLQELCSGNREARNRILLLWHFEDLVKAKYEHFLKLLEAVTHDCVEKTKLKAICVMADLLADNSEQEQYILAKVVNKIGDPVNRVSGGVIHFLNRVLDNHPNMKRVVVDEVERLLFRLNISPRTQYYCLCFLNQLILSPEDDALASHLIRLYFSFFNVCVKKGEVDSKMMSALLSGTSRAFPYAKTRSDALVEHLDTLFKVLHMVNLNISIQALMLIFQALDEGEGPTDRFYSALYKLILDPELATTNRQTMFLNVLFKSLKKDPVDRRVKAFIKRLLQVCYYLPPTLICGILFLISEVLKLKPSLINFTQQVFFTADDEDEEEIYKDIPLEDDDDEQDDNKEGQSEKTTEKTEIELSKGSSWNHIKDKRKSSTNGSTYNPLYWNPLHSGAEISACWELCHLRKHFHPSVMAFVNDLINKTSIEYSGDPLQDFTPLRFLERFVYRNPKKQSESVEQDLHHRVFGRRKLYVSAGPRSIPVSSKNFIFQEEDKVPPEEMFLFQYLRSQERSKLKPKKRKGGDDGDSVNSNEFNQLLDKLEPSWEKIDFASEMQSQKAKKKKQVDEDDDEEEGEELDDDDELEDDLENDEEFKKAFDQYDEDLENLEEPEFEMEGGGSEEDFIDEAPPTKRKKKKDFDPATLFASAEEFAEMLEENATDKHSTIMSTSYVNKEKADAKQLSWETSRDQFVRGSHWKERKGGKHRSIGAFKGNKKSYKKNSKKR